MAFDLVAAGGYGSGEHGDKTGANFEESYGIINWVADVVSITSTQNDSSILELTNIGSVSRSDADDVGFFTGTEVLIFSIATGTTAAAKSFVGKWAVATITDDGNASATITVNKNLSQFSNAAACDCLLRIVTVPHFKNLTLNAGESITPNGGYCPIAFKCSDTLTFNGGHIDLSGKGLSKYDHTQTRPLLNQETNGTLDTDKYSGWENSATKDRLLLNMGDGAAFIIAKKIVVANDESRIGNPDTTGIQYCRGATDSYNVPSGVTNIGGSTILICAGTFTDFTPKLIAKYRTGTATDGNGAGLARCYIASGTTLRNDEGLYAYDNISQPSVVTDTLKIKNFGDGSSGSYNRSLAILNNYAAVRAFSTNRKTLTVTNMTTSGAVAFEPGVLVMVHAKNKDSTNTRFAGRFYLAKILGINGNDITLDTSAAYNTFSNWLGTYYVQIITIPQFTNFTHTSSTSISPKIPAWSDSNGYGGILAIACNGTCNLAGKYLNVMARGGGAAYGENGLNYIGNAQDYGRLPVGQGHGSVFILAKNLVMDEDTRIGAIYSGAVSSDGSNYGGRGGDPNSNGTRGGSGGGYQGATSALPVYAGIHTGGHGTGGCGGGGGVNSGYSNRNNGGYGSSGYMGTKTATTFSQQGAHIMIIADTITGFNQAAISTGGQGAHDVAARNSSTIYDAYGYSGSAGYGGGGAATHGSADGRTCGGGGGYSGGGGGGQCTTCDESYGAGGGGSGWAFIYCNNVVNQDTTDTVAD